MSGFTLRRALVAVAGFAFGAGSLCAAAAFVAWGFSPSEWLGVERFIFLILGACAGLGGAAKALEVAG